MYYDVIRFAIGRSCGVFCHCPATRTSVPRRNQSIVFISMRSNALNLNCCYYCCCCSSIYRERLSCQLNKPPSCLTDPKSEKRYTGGSYACLGYRGKMQSGHVLKCIVLSHCWHGCCFTTPSQKVSVGLASSISLSFDPRTILGGGATINVDGSRAYNI